FTSTFIFFNKTTSPDKILDLLIKLHFPINLSWTVYTTIRQATLLIEDIIYQNKIQQLRRKDNIRYSRIFKIHTMYMLLTSILSRGITTSIEFADALNTRGWNGPHNKLPLNPTKFTLNDFIFLIITMIFPLVLYSVGKLIIN
ncbi:MAG: energy-coupling factor transporter transmembrane protein EcfT, partial [Candidatus Heimdallarchaeota archaeon]|nr:energy-coupling factor transporter transmembrane protein EcfT [Candidatus Heimdallarchaeota archaeon]